MGTVVFPNAEVKVFLVADLEERARRRLLESQPERLPIGATPRTAFKRRPMRFRLATSPTTHREHAPLRRAADAVVLDTTDLTFEEQVQHVVDLVRDHQASTLVDVVPGPF